MTNSTKKKRVRVWTPEDRAAHRVFEKSRREAFNDSLIDLARQIPSLAGTRRLNKHMIVDHSIARHRSQRQMCLSAVQEIRDMLTERDELLTEVNRWRSASGSSLPPRKARPLGQDLRNLLTAENESFGTFPRGFGENPAGGSSGDDHEEFGDSIVEDSGVHMAPMLEIPSQEQQAQHAPLISPEDQRQTMLDLANSSLDAPASEMYAMNGMLDLEGSLDFSNLLDNPHNIDIHSLPTTIPSSIHNTSDITSGSLDIGLHPQMQNEFGYQTEHDIHVPPANFSDIVYEPFHQMQEPYAHQSANAIQPVFPT